MGFADLTNLWLDKRKQIAAWLIEGLRFNQSYVQENLTRWVEENSDSNLVFGTAIAGQATVDFGTMCGVTLADLFQIGEGVQRGGGWGWGADILRALNIVPVGKVASWLRLRRLKEVLTVGQDAGQPYCTWVSTTQAINLASKSKLFASVDDLAAALGLDATIAGGTWAREFVPLLSKIGIVSRSAGTFNGWKPLFNTMKGNTNGVYLMAAEVNGVLHSFLGFWDPVRGCLVFVGRTGKIAARGRNLTNVADEFRFTVNAGNEAKMSSATAKQLLAAKPAGEVVFVEGCRYATKNAFVSHWILGSIAAPLQCFRVDAGRIAEVIREVLPSANRVPKASSARR